MTYNLYQGLTKERMSKFSLLLMATAFAVVASLGIFAPANAATITEPTVTFSVGDPTVEIVDKDGTEALHIVTPESGDKAQVGVTDPDATLGELESLTYTTYREAGTGEQVAALNIVTHPWTGTYVYEPVYDSSATVVDEEWQTWDAFSETARWWNSDDPDTFLTWDQIIAGNEDVEVAGIAVNQGSGNAGLDSYVDWVTVNGEIFDFALTAEEDLTKADCKDGGWSELGFRNQGQCIRFVNTGKDSR